MRTKPNKDITQDRLLSLLTYNPDTGKFTWRAKYGVRSVGFVSGPEGKEYLRIGIDGKYYQAHLLAWLYMTGEFPPDGIEVDHKDRNGLNNRWDNLRLATYSQNARNSTARNKSGVKGVYPTPSGKYQAIIYING